MYSFLALLAVGFANGCIKVLKVEDTLHVKVHDVWIECDNMPISAMCWHVANEVIIFLVEHILNQ